MRSDTTTYSFQPVTKHGIEVYQLKNARQAIDLAYLQLTQEVTRECVLFVSHDVDTSNFFEYMIRFESLEPCAVVMCEEIMGEPFHYHSYERKFEESGLISALSKRGVPFYRILSRSPSLRGTTRIYASRINEILANSKQAHAILALGKDGSLGGISPSDSENHKDLFSEKGCLYTDLVVGYRGAQYGTSGRKVTVSFRLLSRLSTLWVFALGEEKKQFVKRLLKRRLTSHHTFPAAFLQSYPGRVRLYTDQQIESD